MKTLIANLEHKKNELNKNTDSISLLDQPFLSFVFINKMSFRVAGLGLIIFLTIGIIRLLL